LQEKEAEAGALRKELEKLKGDEAARLKQQKKQKQNEELSAMVAKFVTDRSNDYEQRQQNSNVWSQQQQHGLNQQQQQGNWNQPQQNNWSQPQPRLQHGGQQLPSQAAPLQLQQQQQQQQLLLSNGQSQNGSQADAGGQGKQPF
jgi:hypothetical protein